MDYQKIILVGNATDAAKIEKPEGKKMAYIDLFVAVNRNQEEADFFPVRWWPKNVDIAALIKKGSKILVEGRVEINRSKNKEGESRQYVRVLANYLMLLPSQGRNEDGQKPEKA